MVSCSPESPYRRTRATASSPYRRFFSRSAAACNATMSSLPVTASTMVTASTWRSSTSGTSTPSGNRARARSTATRTRSQAVSVSYTVCFMPMMSCTKPARITARISATYSTSLISSSSGLATRCSTWLTSAPGNGTST